MTLKEKISKGLSVCGPHVNLTDPAITEIFSFLPYDYILVDLEHTIMDTEHVYAHLLAARSAGKPLIVRVPADDLTITKKVLEMGIDGIIFPMVRDAAHAKKLLDMTLYPPYGKRGCGPKGAVRYGVDNELEYYGKPHIEKICRFVQIEQKSAADDVENIASLEYLDGCIFGLFDLSADAAGKPGDVFCEENLAMVNKCVEVCKRNKKSVGIMTFATDKETIKRYHDLGINMISTGADYQFILEGAKKSLATMSEILGK
jgi:2-dehydro-3-deoxyglucarate aldolase/4-hydroxy-2-oxoheptanedioate aldolase